MRTAIYIEDGVVQLVITPESEFEKNALSSFKGKEVDTKIFHGSFYDSRGGWIRQSGYFNRGMGYYSEAEDNNDNSIILRISKPKEQA